MLDPSIHEAFDTLRREAGGYSDQMTRDNAIELVNNLEAHFKLLDQYSRRDNPSGKVVVRDEEGKVIGLQG